MNRMAKSKTAKSRAVAYVRRSATHPRCSRFKRYSASKQMEVIREYAKRKGLIIVHEYLDGGTGGGDT